MTPLIKFLTEKVERQEHANNYAPFPVYDTEYINDLKIIIKKLENNNKYDKLPVAACKYCKSLHILNDELENDICVSCGSINDVEVYDNIEEYLKAKEGNDEE